MLNQRRNHERHILEIFEEIACKHNYRAFKGQGRDNRIPLDGNTYFQFGDLRVNTETRYLVIEVESAGGITNLVKYWYCLEKNLIKKPVILFHLFQQSSKADYGSHLSLWEFLWEKMEIALGDRMKAHCYTYNIFEVESEKLKKAAKEFENYLKQY